MNSLHEDAILASWHKNAAPWTDAVRQGRIESRRMATDQAILEAILACRPGRVLDVGCGEGWLTRQLTALHVHATGVDAVPELLARARAAGGGHFQLATYDQIAAGALDATCGGAWDVVVCNFSLLGEDSVERLLHSAPRLLNRRGAFIVQTLHPLTACGDLPYEDGWRQGSWDGFGNRFTDPPPWYFRTLDSWFRLFTDSGLTVAQVREPLHPQTEKPASVILIGTLPPA